MVKLWRKPMEKSCTLQTSSIGLRELHFAWMVRSAEYYVYREKVSNIRTDISSIELCEPNRYYQATCWTCWHHHTVELPSSDDHEKSWRSHCRWMSLYSQASS